MSSERPLTAEQAREQIESANIAMRDAIREINSLRAQLAACQQELDEQKRRYDAANEVAADAAAGLPIDNWPCMACGFGHSAIADKGFETELRERAEAAEAALAKLQALRPRIASVESGCVNRPEVDAVLREVLALLPMCAQQEGR